MKVKSSNPTLFSGYSIIRSCEKIRCFRHDHVLFCLLSSEMFEVFQIDLSVRKCDEPFCRCGNKSVGRSTMTDGQGLNENSLKKQRATEAHGRHLQPRPWEKAGTKKGNPFSILYARRSFYPHSRLTPDIFFLLR